MYLYSAHTLISASMNPAEPKVQYRYINERIGMYCVVLHFYDKVRNRNLLN